jgi:hypothetical protein
MTRFSKLSMIAVALAVLGTSYTAASAETLWQYNHPRRVEVNDRLANQNYRIHQEVMEGELSPGQAVALHAEDHAIRLEERTMAGFNGGHITPYEQHLLNAQENGVSHQIGY